MAERPEDLNLPNAVIGRIIKDALPEGVNIAKDTRLAISKAASVFVLYATSCANNFALKGKRKTISSQDVLLAMSDMEFDRFVDPLKECIEAYKTAQKGKKEAAVKRKSKDANSEDPIVIEEENSEAPAPAKSPRKSTDSSPKKSESPRKAVKPAEEMDYEVIEDSS